MECGLSSRDGRTLFYFRISSPKPSQNPASGRITAAESGLAILGKKGAKGLASKPHGACKPWRLWRCGGILQDFGSNLVSSSFP